MKIEIDAIFHLKSLLKACKKLFINVTTREGGWGVIFFLFFYCQKLPTVLVHTTNESHNTVLMYIRRHGFNNNA